MKEYNIPRKVRAHSPWNRLYHIDCYRLRGPRDLEELDWDNIIKNPLYVVLIEWADRVKNLIPQDAVWVHFETTSKKERHIRVE